MKTEVEILQDSEPTSFGDAIKLRMPAEHGIIIVCTNDGKGLQPHMLCLPHQIYVEKIQDLLKDKPIGSEVIVIPAKSKNYIPVAKKKVAKEGLCLSTRKR